MLTNTDTPIALSKEEFKKIGHELIDRIAAFNDTIRERPVTTGETSGQLQRILGNSSLPENGIAADEILLRASDLLINHSLLNGHPKFFGYITSSPAPAGALADLLAASINPNVGAQILSPIATEIEKQTIKWLAEFIGVSPTFGGILVSGGNMANFTAFLAARTAMADSNIKEEGISNSSGRMMIYCSKATHTWIEKAAFLFGHGTKSIRWIQTDEANKMDTVVLENTIANDIKDGLKPFIVIGNAGDVSTGVVDNLSAIATVSKKYKLWFHIDGAYGVPAAVVPEFKEMFLGIKEADSIAMDPHKWLYSPLETGCTLVKNPKHLTDTYSSHPAYYNFNGNEDAQVQNFYEYGLQNSRGFRALKVWVTLQQAGRMGYISMIKKNIELSRYLYSLADKHPELEAVTQNLSIATFQYIPIDLSLTGDKREKYLNQLNESLLNELQKRGEVFLSNAIVKERYCLRACIVNFNTERKDIDEIAEIIVREGRKMHRQLLNVELHLHI